MHYRRTLFATALSFVLGFLLAREMPGLDRWSAAAWALLGALVVASATALTAGGALRGWSARRRARSMALAGLACAAYALLLHWLGDPRLRLLDRLALAAAAIQLGTALVEHLRAPRP